MKNIQLKSPSFLQLLEKIPLTDSGSSCQALDSVAKLCREEWEELFCSIRYHGKDYNPVSIIPINLFCSSCFRLYFLTQNFGCYSRQCNIAVDTTRLCLWRDLDTMMLRILQKIGRVAAAAATWSTHQLRNVFHADTSFMLIIQLCSLNFCIEWHGRSNFTSSFWDVYYFGLYFLLHSYAPVRWKS